MRSIQPYRTAALTICVALLACSHEKHQHDQPATPRTKHDAAAPTRDAAPPLAAAAVTGPPPGAHLAWYRIQTSVDLAHRVPFLIGIDQDRPQAWIADGKEQMQMIVSSREPLRLRIPVRGTELSFGPPDARGHLHGKWLASYYFKRDFDVEAEPVAGPEPEILFPGGDPPRADFSGEWRIDMQTFGVGRAVFYQQPDGVLDGTIIPPEIGDLRYLSGRVTGDRARLSVFDGMHCFLVEVTAKPGGKEFVGDWEIAGIGDVRFTATRKPAPPTHTEVQAHLAPGKARVTLPGLEEPPYKGNPVIIDYFGTWCPDCIDLAPEIVALHRRYAAQGLQIRSIDLEPPGNEDEIHRRLAEFRETYHVTWPIELRLTDDFNGQVPPEILDATGFPITIFLRRDHTVAAIHTGFVSPAAQVEHQQVLDEFDGFAAQIVASPPPPSGAAQGDGAAAKNGAAAGSGAAASGTR